MNEQDLDKQMLRLCVAAVAMHALLIAGHINAAKLGLEYSDELLAELEAK